MISAQDRIDQAVKAEATRTLRRAQNTISQENREAIKARIIEMREAGKSWRGIAAILNDEGVPTLRGGKQWGMSSVQVVGGYRVSPWGTTGAAARVSTEHTCSVCGRTFMSWSNNELCHRCYSYSRGFKCEGCGAPVGRAHVKNCRGCQNKNQTGEGNGRWKGGRRYTTNGYIYVYVPDHPQTSKAKTIAEHQLVMEDVLGRYLLPGENVHHKNGVKDDNRPENLELWAKTQPAGQRAVDLLAWAREIIDRYQPVEGQLHLFD